MEHIGTNKVEFLLSVYNFQVRSQNCEKNECFVLSVRLSAWNNSVPIGRIFIKFGIWTFIEILSRKFKLYQIRTIITGTLHEDQYTFFIISRSIILIMRNLPDRICRENQTTHFIFNNLFFSKNCAIFEIMWKNIVEPGRPQMTIWRIWIACWIPKGTNTQSE